MATNQQKGNCYFCGVELGKVAMKNHILKQHSDPAGEQECCLIKVEDFFQPSATASGHM